MWKSWEIPLEIISNIMGHSSTKETEKYLRINLDDRADAMERYYNFQLRVRFENAKRLISKKVHQNA